MVERAYKKYQSELLRYARKKVDRSTAEDIVQQAFIDLMECEQVQQERAFLYQSVATNIIDFIRRETFAREYFSQLEERSNEQPDEHAICNEMFAMIKEAIAKSRHSAIAEEVLLDGYSYSEVAKRRGITTSRCRQIIYRVRRLIQNSKLYNSAGETACAAMIQD